MILALEKKQGEGRSEVIMLDVSRQELKYSVNLAETAVLKKRLSVLMKSDAHNGSDGYMVRSLYFDTLQDSDFEDKVEGHDMRQKIRLRIYDPGAQTAKLELKEKADHFQRKRSLSLSREEAEQMIHADYSFLLRREEKLAHWLYTFLLSRGYRPKCVVEYDRFAYVIDHNDTRVTFDKNLRASESCFDIFDRKLMLYPVSKPNEVTMEVKFNGFLMTYIKNELGICDKMQTSGSKYCRARVISKRGRR